MTDIVERLRGSPFEWLADEIARRDAEIERLREALQNIVIGGIGERNFTMSELRAYAEDALK